MEVPDLGIWDLDFLRTMVRFVVESLLVAWFRLESAFELCLVFRLEREDDGSFEGEVEEVASLIRAIVITSVEDFWELVKANGSIELNWQLSDVKIFN